MKRNRTIVVNSTSHVTDLFLNESNFTLPVVLPDVPQHSTGGSRCQGQ